MSTVAVLGAGSWGTTIAIHLAGAGHDVRIWGNDLAQLDEMATTRQNSKFLAGIPLPESIKVQPELELALAGADFHFYVVPSQAVRSVAGKIRGLGASAIPVCASKGLELGTLRRMSEVLGEALGDPAPVAFTGPSHAQEVAVGIPTSIVAACADEARAKAVQVLCSTPRLRVYTNDDVVGCEYGGALKNVMAIAAGVCDGLGYGDNTKGALLTRGLAEISRLGMTMGGRRETFSGLTGMGDLIATAMSRHSRNRHVGERLGKGETLEQVLGGMVMVAEGVNTARAARDLGRERGVELPITEQVCAIALEGKDPREAIRTLMTRDLRSESEDARRKE
ncbi:MAG: NAD(P)-dependent glycerol-3-phosphate dehydrogenase [Candidatus Eisenbacteria bacterium]|nr:NAD(P)-dependent glycerol-3-phosphate dehydrogenase [Candidatus Eisenbacteria bacterium]